MNTARVFVFGTTSNGIAEGGNSLSTEKKKKNGKKEKGRVRSHEDCSHAQQRRKMWGKKMECWTVYFFVPFCMDVDRCSERWKEESWILLPSSETSQ